MPSHAKKRFQPVKLPWLEGNFSAFYPYPSNPTFAIESVSTGRKIPKRIPFNVSVNPLKFYFHKPGTDIDNLPKSRRGVESVEIEMWGAPYKAFTCVVDNQSYIATANAPDRIVWICCENGDNLCEWRRMKPMNKKKKKSPVKPLKIVRKTTKSRKRKTRK